MFPRPLRHQAPTRNRPLAARFLRAADGATAVEFGMLGLPFLALICACLENGLVYWRQEILQQAVTEASRQIYTGQFQKANAGQSNPSVVIGNFRTLVCNQPNGQPRLTLFNCADLRVNVAKADSFSDVKTVSPTAIDSRGVSDWNPGFQTYACVGASTIMIIQAAVDIPVFFPLLGSSMATLPNKRRVLQAATVLKTEPFKQGSVCP